MLIRVKFLKLNSDNITRKVKIELNTNYVGIQKSNATSTSQFGATLARVLTQQNYRCVNFEVRSNSILKVNVLFLKDYYRYRKVVFTNKHYISRKTSGSIFVAIENVEIVEKQ